MCAGRWVRWPTRCGRCSPSSRPARSRSTTGTTSALRRRLPASPMPSITRGSCRPSSARCSVRGRVRSAGRTSGDPAAIRRTDEPCSALPENAARRLDHDGAGAGVQGLPHASAARLRLACAGRPALHELVASVELSAPIVMAGHLDAVRSPRRPRDGGHARRLRRDRRLPLLNALVTRRRARRGCLSTTAVGRDRLFAACRDGRVTDGTTLAAENSSGY